VSPEEWRREETPLSVPGLESLNFLVEDAAGRAAAMLAGVDPAADDEDPLVDAVRLLATGGGSPHTERAARLTGLAADELRGLVLGWRHGGSGGVAAATGASECPADQMADAVREVDRQRGLAIGELEVSQGTIADPGAGLRIRLGPDGRWYPFTFAQDRWWPAPGAARPPGVAWMAALRARSFRRAGG
jgi:hypothetical protein